MAQIILGLDLGSHAVKAVLLESSYRGFTVRDHAEVALPPAGEQPLRARQGAAVAALLAERGWHPDGCVATFPGSALAAHVITLPFTDAKRISQTLAFEVEAQIPFELSEAAWDWQSLGVRGGATDLWVGVAPRAELAELLAALASAGVDPWLVVPPSPTLGALRGAGALPELPPPPAGEPVPCEAILDLGEGRTQLCLFQGAALAAARTWAFGAVPLARAVARDLAVTEAEASQRLGNGTAGEALDRALAPLLREVRTTVRAWRGRVGQRPLARLWLAGGLAGLPGLAERLAAEVDGPVAPLALVGPAAALPAERATSLALALAAALRGHLGVKAGRLNLRRGDLSYTRDFEQVKGKLARLAVAAGAVLLLAIASQVVNVYSLSRQEGAVDRALCDAEEKVLKKCYGNYEEAISVLRGRGVPGASIPKVSAVDVLDELSRRMPEGVPLRLERIDIGEKKLHLGGIADTAEQVDRLVSGLHGSRCFADARSGGARKRASDGKFEFSIDTALSCPEPGAGKE